MNVLQLGTILSMWNCHCEERRETYTVVQICNRRPLARRMLLMKTYLLSESSSILYSAVWHLQELVCLQQLTLCSDNCAVDSNDRFLRLMSNDELSAIMSRLTNIEDRDCVQNWNLAKLHASHQLSLEKIFWQECIAKIARSCVHAVAVRK